MRRRELLLCAGLSTLFLPARLAWPLAAPAAAAGRAERGTLVLVELQGGNDGLNTLVPFAEPAYYEARPRLAVEREDVHPLDEGVGMSPALRALIPAWEAGELGWVQGVGYAQPNRSHFRSSDIWETASDSDEVLEDGWVVRAVPGSAPGDLPDVVVLGGEAGPARGGAMHVVRLSSPEKFAREASRLRELEAIATENPALAHILAVRQEIRAAAGKFEASLATLRPMATEFPKSGIGRQLEQVARMVLAGMEIPVFKVSLGSFDTHFRQRKRHDRLLAQLAEALAAFRTALMEGEAWDQVLVMSYSEFGRRVAENASGGTDHGTAAPHLVLGGKVRGGLYGKHPSLTDLDKRGDLRWTTDYRQLYTTVAQRWWGVEQPEWAERFPALDFL